MKEKPMAARHGVKHDVEAGQQRWNDVIEELETLYGLYATGTLGSMT